MAENTPRNERLPIKLILPRQGKEKKVSGGGSKPLPFRQVNSDFRAGLVSQVSAIRKVLTGQRVPAPAPLRVRLHSKAVAKTHRPEQLFSKATCPIVGAGTLGELFVKATPNGLDALTTLLKTGQSPELLKQ